MENTDHRIVINKFIPILENKIKHRLQDSLIIVYDKTIQIFPLTK